MSYTLYDEYIKKSLKIIQNIDVLYKKSILITGATGLIGSAIADILLKLKREKELGIRIILAGRNKDKLKNRFLYYQEGVDYSFLQYDAFKPILNIDSLKVDYILHCAGNSDPDKYTSQPVETLLTNVLGLNNIILSGLSLGCQRFLYVSSSEIYGLTESNEALKEDNYGFSDILNPRSCYPSGKRAGETLCISYASEYNVDVVIVRPGHIFGPRMNPSDNKASAQFARAASMGRNIVMKSHGLQVRSYCHALDCATAILTVLLNGKSGEAYNISNPLSIVSIRMLAEEFAKAGGVSIVYENPSDEEMRGFNQMKNSSLSSCKLEELGWRPMFNLNIAVRNTVDELKRIISQQ